MSSVHELLTVSYLLKNKTYRSDYIQTSIHKHDSRYYLQSKAKIANNNLDLLHKKGAGYDKVQFLENIFINVEI